MQPPEATGSVGIYEVLEITHDIADLILAQHHNFEDLRRAAQKQGMLTMAEDGLRQIEVRNYLNRRGTPRDEGD